MSLPLPILDLAALAFLLGALPLASVAQLRLLEGVEVERLFLLLYKLKYYRYRCWIRLEMRSSQHRYTHCKFYWRKHHQIL